MSLWSLHALGLHATETAFICARRANEIDILEDMSHKTVAKVMSIAAGVYPPFECLCVVCSSYSVF